MVLFHVIVAFISLALTAYVFMRPSVALLRASAVLIAGTLASGTFLVATKPAHMLETCVMGIIFVALTTTGTVAARHKLAAEAVAVRGNHQ